MSINHDKYKKSTGTHYIASSGSDERKQYKGGQAGDQTGHEAELKKWYNRPWTVVLRYLDQAVADLIANLSIDMCLNDRVGYDQNQRGTYWRELQNADYAPSKITYPCEEDCTSGVSANVKAAGHLCGISALENLPLCTSRNMRAQFTAAGFKALTDKKYLTSSAYLLPGDILLYESHHAACNITLGSKVKADWHPETTIPVQTDADDPDEPDIFEDDEDEEDDWAIEPPYVTVTGSSVNVRMGPSASYGVMGIVHAGDRLHFFGYTDPDEGWLLVEFERQTGWISPKYAETYETESMGEDGLNG